MAKAFTALLLVSAIMSGLSPLDTAPAGALGGSESAVALVTRPNQRGYAILNATGKQYNYGDSKFTGAITTPISAPITDAVAAPNGGTYMLGADGGVFSFGGAPFHGSMANQRMNAPAVAIVAYPDGYVLVGGDGGSFAFGAAPWPGSLAGQRLNAPIVDAAAAPGGGFYMLGADGGVFSFGGAPFHGSMANQRLNAPAVAIVAYPNGYTLVAGDGGSFAFGAAPWPGSLAAQRLNAPIVDAAAAPGGGLYMLGADGGLFAIQALFFGSAVKELNPAPPPNNPPGSGPNTRKVPCPGSGSSIVVDASIATQLSRLLDHAARDGIRLCGGGYRDTVAQWNLRKKNCPDPVSSPANACSPPTAKVGSSLHQLGLAIDFTYAGKSIVSHESPGFEWLAANARTYGLRNLPSEPWHWSTTGG